MALAYLSRGPLRSGVEESFRIALEIETSEIDAIYGKLLQLGGPKIAQTMENLRVPASVQRRKLKLALRNSAPIQVWSKQSKAFDKSRNSSPPLDTARGVLDVC